MHTVHDVYARPTVSAVQHFCYEVTGGRRIKGNTMSHAKAAKPARIDIPGLAYFTPDLPQKPKAAAKTPRNDLALLEQMYGYFTE